MVYSDEICPDCGAADGQLHDLYCTKENCPFCGDQLITCDCKFKVLVLDESERRALAEGLDDTVDPLKSIKAVWLQALEQKGRVPFKALRLSFTPEGLISMAARGELPLVEKLLDGGIEPDCANFIGQTPLMAAAQNSQIEVMALLLKMGADVNRKNEYGRTPLDCAVSANLLNPERQAACVKILLHHGARLSEIAESKGNEKIALLLGASQLTRKDTKPSTRWSRWVKKVQKFLGPFSPLT